MLNGILRVLRSGAPWRDLSENFGPYTTCYNRFVRWRRAGVWDRRMNALTAGHDAAVQMIDTSIVRVHQHGAASLVTVNNLTETKSAAWLFVAAVTISVMRAVINRGHRQMQAKSHLALMAPAICSARQRLKASGWRGIELGPVELLLNAVKDFFADLAPRAQAVQCRALGGNRA